MLGYSRIFAAPAQRTALCAPEVDQRSPADRLRRRKSAAVECTIGVSSYRFDENGALGVLLILHLLPEDWFAHLKRREDRICIPTLPGTRKYGGPNQLEVAHAGRRDRFRATITTEISAAVL